ncbi:uncharacterized protein TRIADDRAFT_54291 [Trichoplax adhaerens]|uniref:Perilipin n=1 Tax=Trichoplax adhaerens TaxID=10228 RepID=B3RRM2_TRIAD|nr:hypothetical protein TRIADDRAFT_54291 [Trichoplax adhaerens]EDV26375.1 hypothetical protein TRIADDRAFT_54291 [Trichoplax adhaerens]|eukprot:XP_002110371.1 hypothetical protein TRIADDRAFT_54291 [Trichoplax adhaerens]
MTMDGEMSTLATVQRLSSYPVINFAVNQVSSVYQTTKVKSDMLKGGLDKIETSVTNILTSALQPFQQQIVAADGFASRQLEKLEEKIPIVKESSDKIRTRFEDNLKANIDCVRKSYLVERVSNGIDKVLDVTDNTVEYILPGVDELEVKTASDPNQDNKITEMLEENEESATGKVDRIYTLTSKVKRRLFTQMVTRLENVKQRGPEIISKFKYSVDLIAYDKSLDKKSPFTDESVAGEESTASAKTESNIRPEGKFSYLKKELSNIRSTVSVKLVLYYKHY